jgi:hypothetical protein
LNAIGDDEVRRLLRIRLFFFRGSSAGGPEKAVVIVASASIRTGRIIIRSKLR